MRIFFLGLIFSAGFAQAFPSNTVLTCQSKQQGLPNAQGISLTLDPSSGGMNGLGELRRAYVQCNRSGCPKEETFLIGVLPLTSVELLADQEHLVPLTQRYFKIVRVYLDRVGMEWTQIKNERLNPVEYWEGTYDRKTHVVSYNVHDFLDCTHP